MWSAHVRTLPQVFASSPSREAQDHPLFMQWRTRIEYFVYHTYGNQRLRDFFDIVVEFPDSEAAIEDLRTCLSMTAQHEQLIYEVALCRRSPCRCA